MRAWRHASGGRRLLELAFVLRASLSGSRQVVRHLQKAIQLRLTSLPQFLCKARRDSSRADQEIGRDVPDGGFGMTARDPAHRQKWLYRGAGLNPGATLKAKKERTTSKTILQRFLRDSRRAVEHSERMEQINVKMTQEDFQMLKKAADRRWPDAVITNSGIVFALAKIAARQTLAKKRA
jgi:hypothetical protein